MSKHRAIPQGYMTVGEAAKKMNLTVRTLQYYDGDCKYKTKKLRYVFVTSKPKSAKGHLVNVSHSTVSHSM